MHTERNREGEGCRERDPEKEEMSERRERPIIRRSQTHSQPQTRAERGSAWTWPTAGPPGAACTLGSRWSSRGRGAPPWAPEPAAAAPHAEPRRCRGGGLGPPGPVHGRPPALGSAPPAHALHPGREGPQVRGGVGLCDPTLGSPIFSGWQCFGGGWRVGRRRRSPPGFAEPGSLMSCVLGTRSLLSPFPQQSCEVGTIIHPHFPDEETEAQRAEVTVGSLPLRPPDPKPHLPGQPTLLA